MNQRIEAVQQWLLTWQDLIAQGDFDAARQLFESDVVGFGTVAVRADGLPELVELQWQNVWTRTSGFRFLLDTLKVWGDAQLWVVAVQWVSTGQEPNTGASFERQGRSTIALLWDGQALRAQHTHFSLNPARERFLPV